MRNLSEALKLDTLLPYQVLATPAPGVRSRYVRVRDYGKILFVFIVDTLAAAETVIATVIQATSAAGAGAAAIATATCTATANALCNVVTVTLATVLATETIVINGVTFTAAGAADLPNQVFDQSGTDTQDAASLVLAINHAAAQALFLAGGLGLVTATSAAAVVTLTVTNPGEGSLTVVPGAATMTAATVEAIGYVEIEETALTGLNTHAALQLVGPNTVHGVVCCIRGQARYAAPAQFVAAHDMDS